MQYAICKMVLAALDTMETMAKTESKKDSYSLEFRSKLLKVTFACGELKKMIEDIKIGY